MKKITIKHYLNTAAKPERIRGGVTAYPLYLQIVTNRTNQKIKSFFDVYMSEGDYNKMINHEQYGNETETGNPEMWGRSVDDETVLLEKAIRYLWENEIEFNTKTKYFKKYVEEYIKPAVYLFKAAAGDIESEDVESGVLVSCLNIYEKYSKRTLIQVAKDIKAITKIDILDYIDSPHIIKVWQVVELVKITAKEMTLFEFVEDNHTEKILRAAEDPKIRDFCQISDKRDLQKYEIIQILQDLERRIKVRASTIFN